MDRAGAYLHGRGAYADAEPLLREALAIHEKSLGREHPDIGIRLNDLANLLRHTGRHSEAERLYRESLAISEKAHGHEDPKVAVTLNNLANLLRQTGRYAEAEPLLREALKISEGKLGRKHPDIGIQLNNLANVLYHIGRHAEAASTVASGHATAHPYRPRNPLTRRNHRLAETGLAFISSRAHGRQGQASGGAEEARSLTAAARDGDGNMRSGRKNARGAGRTQE